MQKSTQRPQKREGMCATAATTLGATSSKWCPEPHELTGAEIGLIASWSVAGAGLLGYAGYTLYARRANALYTSVNT